ncbi:MAG: hypothetical protein IPL27_06550 [Lewinellaceae bacterium]|nr:hypothetical protein [Lewinellaceae bacterium]
MLTDRRLLPRRVLHSCTGCLLQNRTYLDADQLLYLPIPDDPCFEQLRANGRSIRVWDSNPSPTVDNTPNCVTYKQIIKVIDQTPPTVTCAPIDDYSLLIRTIPLLERRRPVVG